MHNYASNTHLFFYLALKAPSFSPLPPVRLVRLQNFDENQNTFCNSQRNYFRLTLFLASYSAGLEIDQLCLRRCLTKRRRSCQISDRDFRRLADATICMPKIERPCYNVAGEIRPAQQDDSPQWLRRGHVTSRIRTHPHPSNHRSSSPQLCPLQTGPKLCTSCAHWPEATSRREILHLLRHGQLNHPLRFPQSPSLRGR
jgi:hypothetical protein